MPALSRLHLPGGSGNTASTPDHASLDITGNVCLIADVALDDYTNGTQTLVSKWTEAGALRSYDFNIGGNGDLIARISSSGANVISFTVPFGFSIVLFLGTVLNGDRVGLRTDILPNNGAGGRTASFFYSLGGAAGPWLLIGAPVVQATPVSIAVKNPALIAGAINGGTLNIAQGKFFGAKVISGDFASGTVVADADFTAQPRGTRQFTDTPGRLWTVNGAGSIVDDGLLHQERFRIAHDERFHLRHQERDFAIRYQETA